MHMSRPIEVAGRFLGVVVTQESGWRYVAIDPVTDDLHGASFPSPEEATRVARLVVARATRGRMAAHTP